MMTTIVNLSRMMTTIVNAPNKATPITLPTWRVVLGTPEATPDCLQSTVANKADVIGGTVKPMPAPMMIVCHQRSL
jgi:hypothetical protein